MARTKKQNTYDIIVVGGGLAGLTMAAYAGQAGYTVCVVDRVDPKQAVSAKYDGRTTAISYGSSKILDHIGAWQGLVPKGEPITAIDVQDNHAPFILNFDAQDVGGQPFGWIFDNLDIRIALYDVLKKKKNVYFEAPAEVLGWAADPQSDHATVTLQDKELNAKLVIAADGRPSKLRTWADIDLVYHDYKQRALVGTVIHEHPHNGLAVERFMTDGPFAILPMTDDAQGRHRSAMVWTMHSGRTGRDYSTLPDDIFQIELERRFDDRYGAVHWEGSKMIYPLTLYHAKQMIGARLALISDAAHGMHPIAGQGLNVGMQDIGVLSGMLKAAKGGASSIIPDVIGDLERGNDVGRIDIGSPEFLREYQAVRRWPVFQMIAATDLLNRLFANNNPALRALRTIGLGAVNRISPLKKFFMKTAMGKTK